MREGDWIAFDLDGVLAYYTNWETNEWSIGEPIQPVVDLLKNWMEQGYEVRILTARAGLTAARNENGQAATEEYQEKQVDLIGKWCQEHLGFVPVITASKDFKMIRMYDDRCIQMIPNRGISVMEMYGVSEFDIEEVSR